MVQRERGVTINQEVKETRTQGLKWVSYSIASAYAVLPQLTSGTSGQYTVGAAVGDVEGTGVGEVEGAGVGDVDGLSVGASVGISVGDSGGLCEFRRKR